MDITTLLLLAVALGTDAFSLSIGIGMSGITLKKAIFISFTVLVFHIIMPITGYVAGDIFGTLLGRIATVTGALVLIYIGIKMAVEAIKDNNGDNDNIIIANTWGVILLAGSVSLDALSVGFTLGTRQVALGSAVILIGIVAGIMTFTGLGFGKKLGNWIGEKSEVLGGVILIAIGIKLFF